MLRRYALITPCRDEAVHARRTLDSVFAQSIPPAIWVVVDDGSTDATSEIVSEYAATHPALRLIRREDRGARAVGPGVVDAFYAGYETIDPSAYDYICKLDLDLELPVRYFETLMERMEANPRIGTCSGAAYFRSHGRLVSEGITAEMSAGMTKFYRVECFEEIGGFVRQVMWDGIDCHRCRMLGWIACSWDEPALRFIHLRPMGSSQTGLWVGRKRHGFGQYFMGTGLAYMSASALYRTTRPPRLFGGVAMWIGYVESMLRRVERYDNPGFRRFLRAYQRSCLLHGKRRATERLNARMAGQWAATHSTRAGKEASVNT